MSEETTTTIPSLEDWQHWALVMARANQMIMEAWADNLAQGKSMPGFGLPVAHATNDPMAWMTAGADAWSKGMEAWSQMLGQYTAAGEQKDRRFSSPEWRESPIFDTVRQSYLAISDKLLGTVEDLDGIDDEARDRLRFATKGFVEAMSPANFMATNPDVMKRTVETKGENLLSGLKNMLGDITRGQVTQSPEGAFELGRNLATTPGKVIYETKLFQLIQYDPTTDEVLETPLVIFPPWINRFYILDLTPEKSFVKWTVDQGVTLFMVSWKSADESIRDIGMDDYVAAQEEAVDVIRDLLGVDKVHTIGYCVAGTTMAATLAYLAGKGEADKVASATFFTAQVDFEDPGDLKMFVGDDTLATLKQLTAETGVLDGRVMAATFNLLRGKDLIWNYVVNNYLMGNDPTPFDLLHWNGDVTNLPGEWHRDYLERLYRQNLMMTPGALSVKGVPIDLGSIETPAYIQAGREDHIAPAPSVWKLTRVLKGPKRFILAGSGHIAGVVNPPAANKYQYWTSDEPATTLQEFIAYSTEHKGSWWPDWIQWLNGQGHGKVKATGARVPGKGKLKPIEDAPGRYVRTR
ncbi:class I poly(R)-hydroxyalkanoic acid synthase [Sphingomonas sp. RB56-2]|uniref:Class I poly(R)-hydroxyalkanoic acid synthase n=1 Tax=Sphingomonas brevis TaxID=2908206 RepID=A0ABT0SAF6_9SPHN|nr:class I poly(R)-hydroxyalkanoic acid synthase [Sphingomonas brevis]MCL6741142.1 class I poly(R)-hydroxyalkanoic acid synthase [Sphingomonas brevis]